MEMTKREKLQKWSDTWKVTGPLLEQFRADDLAGLTDKTAVEQFIGISCGPVFYDAPDDGLIKQQRLFQELAPCLA